MTEVSFDKLCDSKIDIPVLPEGCSMTKAIRDAHFRVAHITRDQYGNFHERLGWLVTDVTCHDDSRVASSTTTRRSSLTFLPLKSQSSVVAKRFADG